jgi:hypothetical protein
MSLKAGSHESGQLVANGRSVEYRVKPSNTAKLLRVRVGPRGVEVVQPKHRSAEEVQDFIAEHATWVGEQIERVERLRTIQRTKQTRNSLLFQGQQTPVVALLDPARRAPNRVEFDGTQIRILCGPAGIEPHRSLEHWFRREARSRVLPLVDEVARKIGCRPGKIYVMDQQTKWGNCSARGNLSFSWRLVLAPSLVMRYLVAHEVVHLAVPDHSKRFWLTLRSVCQESDRARQWLVANETYLRLPARRTGTNTLQR